MSVRGRGATVNPANRFDRLTFEPDPECGPGENVATEVFVDATRSILAKNDSPDVPMSRSLNPYRRCEHGCAYCYARPMHEWLGMSAGLDFETKILVKEGALHPGDFVSSLRRSRPSFERCYQRALVRSPDLSGTVQLNMRFVDRKHAARPQTVAIPSSSLGDKETHRCLANALMNTKFPHSAAGSEVSVKMAFAPKK